MKIGILATGITEGELLDRFGSYSDMVMQLFKRAGYDFEYQVFDVREGDFPQGAEQCDGWLITGSKHSVYENLEWIQKLKQLVREVYAANRPLIGICFGHQLIAEALDGKVEKYHGGWGVGQHNYALTDGFEFNDSGIGSFCLNAIHQDQVVIKPASAEVIASSDFCRYAGLIYDNNVLTFQAHPEFEASYEKALLERLKGNAIPADISEQGLKTLQQDTAAVDSLVIAGWMASFLHKVATESNTCDMAV